MAAIVLAHIPSESLLQLLDVCRVLVSVSRTCFRQLCLLAMALGGGENL